MKFAIAALAFTFSVSATAAEFHFSKNSGTIYGSSAKNYEIGLSEEIVPGTLEVARYLESLPENSGGVCDGEFSHINGKYYVFALRDCK